VEETGMNALTAFWKILVNINEKEKGVFEDLK
jgi:hypothetical protein